MGWNSWNRFGCDINEEKIRGVADALVESGMRDAGYEYLNLDDCWQTDRTPAGEIVVDPVRFPSGMKALGDYVHARGLKFGTYTCAGTMTCQQRPGSAGHDARDALSYASWGVDFVKEDWCFTDGMDPRERYAAMRDAIAASGRDMVLSLCNWGREQPWIWGREMGSLWRTSGDISDSFLMMMVNMEQTWPLAPYAGPGGWNDPDMLEVGNGGMTADEYRAHFSLWAMMAAPLIAGNDVRSMTQETRDILMNAEVIAVDQDPAGVAGTKVRIDTVELWARPLTEAGARAVLLFNRDSEPRPGGFAWDEVGLAPGDATLRDLWRRTDLGTRSGRFDTTVPPHGVVMVVVRGAEHRPPAGEARLADLPWKHAAASPGPVERVTSVTVGGQPLGSGLGVGAASVVMFDLGGRCTRFRARAGVDDATGGKGTVAFEVRAGGERGFASGVIRGGDAAVPVEVALDGARELVLVTGPGGDDERGDRAVWADARVECM
ncbi:MAG: NPCBM/NEW2 domain-containing protein [Deltaproteobacteria bacterium]|nr:NPCBM/NEW2 domain-containing protein [Deltaproteobacteria bacterium]